MLRPSIRPWLSSLRPLLLALLLAGLWFGSAQQIGFAQADPALTQVVVKLNPLSGATINDINATYGTTTLDTVLGSAGIYLLQTPAGQTAKDVAGKMELDLRLLYAEPNFVGEAPEGVGRVSWVWGGPNPAPMAGQYATTLLGLPNAHKLSRGGGVVVAVLDQGVQLNHPELAATWTAARYDFVNDDAVPEDEANGIDEDGDGFADNTFGHGTHVAGIVHLVAPDAKIMPLRVLDTEGRGNIFTLAEAILYAVNQGAKVINLSLGTAEKSDLLDDITRQATQRGVTVVAAAGNLNSKEEQYPAASQCVLAITAINAQQVKANFANWGSWVDFATPGDAIYSPLPVNGYGWWSGTSMATPFVAGQAALAYSLKPTLTVRQMADLIAGTARSLDKINPKYKKKLGTGLPAIDVSLQRLLSGKLPKKGGSISGSCSEVAGTAAATVEGSAEAYGEEEYPVEETDAYMAEEDVAVETVEEMAPAEPLHLFLPFIAN